MVGQGYKGQKQTCKGQQTIYKSKETFLKTKQKPSKYLTRPLKPIQAFKVTTNLLNCQRRLIKVRPLCLKANARLLNAK